MDKVDVNDDSNEFKCTVCSKQIKASELALSWLCTFSAGAVGVPILCEDCLCCPSCGEEVSVSVVFAQKTTDGGRRVFGPVGYGIHCTRCGYQTGCTERELTVFQMLARSRAMYDGKLPPDSCLKGDDEKDCEKCELKIACDKIQHSVKEKQEERESVN